MERDTVRHQAQIASKNQQVHGHVGLAAEFARQRPVSGGRAFSQDTHIDFRARCCLGDVAQVGFGIGCKQTHALLVEVANVLGFLDGVAVAHALRADTTAHDLVQFVDRRDVEARTLVLEQIDDFNGRVGFDGVVNLGKLEARTQVVVGLADDGGINDHERRFLLVSERLHFLEGVG